jgi:hypothetical protein
MPLSLADAISATLIFHCHAAIIFFAYRLFHFIFSVFAD